MHAGFIGLGHLGSAMAKRLLSQGVELTVYNRTKGKAQGLGAEVAESPAALASSVDVVFLCLADSAAVDSVLSEILPCGAENTVFVDTTTNHFQAAARFHDTVADAGGAYLECPVMGSVAPALAGKLAMLVGGDRGAFERVESYLHRIADPVIYLGKPGLATRMKLVNNAVMGVFLCALAEGVALGEEAGVDRAKVLEILDAGAGHSRILAAKRQNLLEEDYETSFPAAWMYKDLHLAQELARAVKRPFFSGSMAKDLFALTQTGDRERLDFSVIYDVLKEL